MKKILERSLLLLFFCLLGQLTCQADVFKGKIVNAETGEVLAGASVKGVVSPQPGWTCANTVETDSTGCFLLQAPMEGRIVFTFSMIGYKIQRKVDYAYGSEVQDTTDLGIIRLAPTTLMLQEVEVKASLPRFTMRGDTIVFNSEAFKLQEGARLEELIRKLPGVYQQDGKLYWNNKPIRLTMNGKNVFGGDAILGQLPAEAAKKLKLYDRKSELARHTGRDDGNEDQVLDIQVKPGFLDKWYGEVKLEGGYKDEARYSGNVTAHKLSDSDPQLVFGQANNINRYYERDWNMSMNRNIDDDGKSQYGSYNYQHNWKKQGLEAFDNNHVGISANLGHSDGLGEVNTITETYLPNTDHTISQKRNTNYNHKLNPQLEANLFAYTDSANTISVSAKASYEKTRNTSEDEALVYSGALNDRLITRNRNYTLANSEDKNLWIQYAWEHFLGKKGSYGLSGYTNLQGVENHQTTNRNLEYLSEGASETLCQEYDSPTRNMQTALEGSLNYWLGKKVYISLSDQVSNVRYHERRNVLDDTANDKDNLMHTYQNVLSFNSTMTLAKGVMIMPKLVWTSKRTKADYHYGDLDTLAVRKYNLLDPSLRLKWKISRERNMDLSFAYTTATPELEQTIGFRDTMNPLYISMGNSRLDNSHSHTTTYNYHRMWLRQQIAVALSASYRKDIHPLTELYSYNPSSGVYELMPVNVKGGEMWKFGFNYDQGLGVFWRVANQLSVSTARSYGYMTVVNDGTKPHGGLLDAEDQLQLNRQRLFNMTDNLELSYESDNLKVSLLNQLQWNRYRYTDATYNSSPVYDQFGATVTWVFRPFTLMAYVMDNFRSGYQTPGMNGHKVMSIARLEYRFYKDKCCLSLLANDIFNQDKNYNVETTAYQRTEMSHENLHHYLMVGFSYRFDAKVKK